MPHGQGFIAQTSWNRAGYTHRALTREMVTTPSSMGWRRASSTARGNSGSSSRNSTPLCALEISPGAAARPPPMSATALVVWCGAEKGRRVISPPETSPDTEWMTVVSSASCSVMRGRMPGRQRASMVLPEPAVPMSPPLAAISSALRAAYCPRTDARSTSGRTSSARSAYRTGVSGAISASPQRKAAACRKLSTG